MDEVKIEASISGPVGGEVEVVPETGKPPFKAQLRLFLPRTGGYEISLNSTDTGGRLLSSTRLSAHVEGPLSVSFDRDVAVVKPGGYTLVKFRIDKTVREVWR
ncbi:hypothetical protein HRbin02_01892 [Candidatus Calditenuaceae archaeon HR02]|nr:hypothetical protein HRbin02_01892 [Candidatus Calditenuaceae archaeon HR02]